MTIENKARGEKEGLISRVKGGTSELNKNGWLKGINPGMSATIILDDTIGYVIVVWGYAIYEIENSKGHCWW